MGTEILTESLNPTRVKASLLILPKLFKTSVRELMFTKFEIDSAFPKEAYKIVLHGICFLLSRFSDRGKGFQRDMYPIQPSIKPYHTESCKKSLDLLFCMKKKLIYLLHKGSWGLGTNFGVLSNLYSVSKRERQ